MTTFRELGLNDQLVQAVEALGFTSPTPIQEQCIPFLLRSKQDLIALAQTGTGKTAAFSLPILEQIDATADTPQVLILCPTRELCLQISNDIERYITNSKALRVVAVYGGERVDIQMKRLRDRPQIVVGTPGRVQDFINKKVLRLQNLQWVVLDEADEMLNMGFKEEITEILKSTPEEKQTLLFSATMPSAIETIAKKFMKTPERIAVAKRNEGSSNIQHMYYAVHGRDRYQALRRIIDIEPDMYGIIFCRTRRETQELSDQMLLDGYSVEAIHGELTQEHRTYVMNRFRKKQISFLVATDVAARGIDVQNLSHVINYTLPDNVETYVHRSGRTGRAMNVGVSIVIVHMRETGKIREIERISGKQFTRGIVPSGKEVQQKLITHFVEKLSTMEGVQETGLDEYMTFAKEKLSKLTKEKLIENIIALECAQVLANYTNATDLNVAVRIDTGSGRFGTTGGRRETKGNMTEVTLSIGKKHGVGIKDLFGMINKQRSLKGMELGNIKIAESVTYMEVDRDRVRDIQRWISGTEFRGNTIVVKMNTEKRAGGSDRSASGKPMGRAPRERKRYR